EGRAPVRVGTATAEPYQRVSARGTGRPPRNTFFPFRGRPPRPRPSLLRDAGQRSQVLKMAFVKCQAYLSVFGFFDSPAARARIVMGTSRMRSRFRMPSISSSDAQN